MTLTVSVRELHDGLSQLLDRVGYENATVLITRHGCTVAKITKCVEVGAGARGGAKNAKGKKVSRDVGAGASAS